jgi:2-dehydro-3-deoxygluconokinase
MLRLSPPTGRRIENADVLDVHAAGAEANVLAGLARLGVPSALVSVLPETPLGRRAAAELAAAGVELGRIGWIANGRMGTFFVEHGLGARSTSVLYDRAGSALAEAIQRPPGSLDGVCYALVSGITPALSVAARDATSAMFAEAADRGVPVCVDVNYRSRLWSPEMARECLSPILARAGVVVCSARDADTVFGAGADDPARFRARWAPQASVCVITAGDSGARAVAETDEVVAVEALDTFVVDRLGLGDAFVAGLLDGLLRHCSVEEALRAGTVLAAMKATVAGDLSLTRRQELDALLARSARSEVLR